MRNYVTGLRGRRVHKFESKKADAPTAYAQDVKKGERVAVVTLEL